MTSYLIHPKSISSFSEKGFSKYSLSARDYRKLLIKNTNTKKLKNLMSSNEEVGNEIGSEKYMKSSKYRFLKTVNITSNFLLDETRVEFSKPILKKNPKKGDIFIVKDGGGEGLGEVCIYDKDNEDKLDSISAGIIRITLDDKDKNYVIGFLKSKHFKDFVDINTAQGSTIRHSKKISLDYDVPFPTKNNNASPDAVKEMVSLIVQNIINKEETIKKKKELIDQITYEELINHQNKTTYQYNYPKKSELLSKGRLDCGTYVEEYKKNMFLIQNYVNGFFKMPNEDFKSGSTPKIRVFSKNKYFKWVTPSNILDNGFYDFEEEDINMPIKNNINKDCMLFINRTSKGKKGEFVGISCFYDINYYGRGHHNQGIYRVEKFEKEQMLFIISFMNSKIMRELCGNISLGSKMKEMKSNDFSDLLFPVFPKKSKDDIVALYYNEKKKIKDNSLINYIQNEFIRNKELGIFQLNAEIKLLKKILWQIIDKIIKDEHIDITYDY